MSRTLSQLLISTPSLLYLLHPDTMNYRNRLLAKGGRISTSHLLGIDKFVKDIYANNLRSFILECYPFAGENLFSSLTKLWHTASSEITNVGLVEGNYGIATGITGSGTGYLNSNFTPNTSSLTTTSASIGVYNRTNSFQSGAITGQVDGSGNNTFNLLVGWGDNLNYFDSFNQVAGAGRLVTGISANCQRLSIGTRVSATDSRFFRDGTQITANATSGGGLPTVPMFWLAYNNNGSPIFYSTKSIGFAFVGRGLTAAQSSTLTTIVNQLMTTLGRAV